MNKELPKAYEPQQYEDGIYKRWEDSGFFNPDNLKGAPYSIMMPPPNVTGVLHLGHALENSLMDVMARFQRMQGKKVLLLPGTDHAAVATQARVEKNLVQAGMKNPRIELGREGLLEKIREYSENSKSTILRQIKKMGTSADWSRLAYTFDEDRSKAVNAVFKKMFDDGLIYRGYRVVNWSTKGQSTCSDDEVIYIDRKAKLYTFKYSEDFPFTIATTRPETKLGDTAVAVNPNDERYKKYIGKIFKVNFCGVDLTLKIIADEHVDPKFGTGALGVTPAHSQVDFEMYERKKEEGDLIELIQVIGEDGKMTTQAGSEFVGLTVEETRDKVVEKLKSEGLFVSEEEIEQNVGTSDRFGDVIEALPMTQWFVAVNKEIPGKGKTLKQLVLDATTVGHNGDPEQKINLIPENQFKRHIERIEHLHDWCISRQIWWGHRIPVWYKEGTRNNEQGTNDLYVGVEPPKDLDNWEQDPDTLDTWFSSGLWTFSTVGWPDEKIFQKNRGFHPTSWMQMGHEILFLWFQRMVMLSTYILDEIPFKNVYIHGILRDKDGKKFSKSSGNGIDPLDVIKEYGTDALRFSLLSGITPGNDTRFYLEKVEGSRNLVNKLWNVCRFSLTIISGIDFEQTTKNWTDSDRWILSKFNRLKSEVTDDLESFNFSQASEKLRDFTWNDLADWYLEIAKIEQHKEKDAVLSYLLPDLLKLWHPFMPFVTEELWRAIRLNDKSELLMVSQWPTVDGNSIHKKGEENFEIIKNIVTKIRSLRAENKIEPAKKLNVVISAGDKVTLLQENAEVIKGLARLESLTIEEKVEKPANVIGFVESGVEVFINLEGVVDFAKEKERLTKEITQLKGYVSGLEKKLSNKEFVNNAPEAVVIKEKEKLQEGKEKLEKLGQQLQSLQ